jgi:uncharacterized membrane protein YgaE (UPF0421/DUF939 family)
MSTTFYTNLKNKLLKLFTVPFFVGLALGLVITTFAFISPQVLSSYRLNRVQNAYNQELSKCTQPLENQVQTPPDQYLKANQNILENEKLIATKNQAKWDEAKKTSDFKAVSDQIANQGGEEPQTGDCI